MFTRVLPETAEFDQVRRGGEGLDLADSITGDGHKMLMFPMTRASFSRDIEKFKARCFEIQTLLT